MKTVLKIATVLTWFNLVVWIFIILLITLAFCYMQFISLLFIPFLLMAIVLNCYAALRLQKALRSPAIQLSNVMNGSHPGVFPDRLVYSERFPYYSKMPIKNLASGALTIHTRYKKVFSRYFLPRVCSNIIPEKIKI